MTKQADIVCTVDLLWQVCGRSVGKSKLHNDFDVYITFCGYSCGYYHKNIGPFDERVVEYNVEMWMIIKYQNDTTFSRLQIPDCLQ